MVSQKKQQLKEKLQEKLAKAKSIVLVDYTGLTVPQQEKLRKKVREVGGEFTVTKNTLLKLAMENVKDLPGELAESEVLHGPTATLFSFQDGLAAIKALVNFSEEFELLKVKIGFFEGQVLAKEGILELAKIPDKEELLAWMAYLLQSPISGLPRILSANMGKLINLINLISNQKEGGEN